MNILLLHGALSTSHQLLPLQRELERFATLHLHNFPGHGLVEKKYFTMEGLVSSLEEEVLKFGSDPINIFGYSMGGYAALCLATKVSVNKIITLGTKLEWNPAASEKEIKMLNPEAIKGKVPAFAESLEKLHGGGWPELVKNTAAMMRQLGDSPLLNGETFGKVSGKVKLLHGAEDKMVSWEETNAAAMQMPDAVAVSLPGVPHALEKTDPLLLASQVLDFFQ